MAKSDDKNESESRSTGEAARRILLAGIGAYGRAFMEAQEALKDVRGKSSDVFDELVQKGEMMEMAFEHKSKQMMDKASIPNLHIDDRIKKMRARLARQAGGSLSDNGGGSEDIHARLDQLEQKLDAVIALLETGKPKTAKRKNAPKATAAKTKTKTKAPAKTKRTPKKA